MPFPDTIIVKATSSFLFYLDEISEVKKRSIDFVRKSLEKKGTSFTYILVPFSDPGKYQIVIC